MQVVPLQHTRLRCVRVGADAGGRLRRRSLAGVMVCHPARLCDSDLAGLRPGLGRGPHGRRAGLAGHLAWVICGQSLDGVGHEPCGRAAHLRRDPDQYRRGSYRAGPGRGRAGAPLGGLSEPAHPCPRHLHLSAAGRTAQLPGECHCWRHDSGGQRPDPVVAVRHDVVDVVGGGHARRPHRHAAGAELAR